MSSSVGSAAVVGSVSVSWSRRARRSGDVLVERADAGLAGRESAVLGGEQVALDSGFGLAQVGFHRGELCGVGGLFDVDGLPGGAGSIVGDAGPLVGRVDRVEEGGVELVGGELLGAVARKMNTTPVRDRQNANP